jgi:hypothetical protein
MSMTRTVSTTLVLIVMSYTAIPHIVSALADNTRLQQQLQRRNVELSEARAELEQMRYRAMQPTHVELAEDDALRLAEQYRKRSQAAVARWERLPGTSNRSSSAAPAEMLAPAPQSLGAETRRWVETRAAAAAFRNPQCRDEWLERRHRAASSPFSPAHPEPMPFAGGNLAEPGVLEAALEARAPGKELIFLSVGDTRDHRREIKDPVPAALPEPPACHQRPPRSPPPAPPSRRPAHCHARATGPRRRCARSRSTSSSTCSLT